jgi:2-methylisocitrate lyase-like PEP mutase family enzyme
MPSVAEKRRLFRELHRSGCFVLPNPFDVGGALWLQRNGFKALATTSAGAAWALGLPDGGVSREAMLAHIRDLVAACDVPVNADFGNAFADAPDDVAGNVAACVATGVAGLSIEDATGDPAKPLYEIGDAVERVAAARRAIDANGGDTILVARAECFLVGHENPLRESIRRLVAYAEAGADCLYAPGPRRRDDIEAIVKALAPKPVNVLVGGAIGLTVADLAALGVRRVSVGGALARAAWGGFLRAARGLAEGRFDGFADIPVYAEVDGFFRDETRKVPA